MPLRKIVRIDEDKCTGCGNCVPACHEGALQIVDGKARLVKEIYCDGLGDCLGECPEDAITIEEREAEDFDEKAVERHLKQMKKKPAEKSDEKLPCGCPGSALQDFTGAAAAGTGGGEVSSVPLQSRLGHWPIQIMLVPPNAPFLEDADLLVAADCTPFVLPHIHEKYLKGKAVLVGCPKLDDNDFYLEKLATIFAVARPKSITVLRMEVPCCGGIAKSVVEARDRAGLDVPVEIHTAGVRGGIIRKEKVEAGAKA